MLSRLKFEIDPLVREMLDQIPENIWTSKTTTFLDPAMGGGQFIKAIIERLRSYGHSDKNIQKRVFGIEKLPHRLTYATKKNKLIGRLSLGDFLNQDFGNMNFEIVGNPPYQDSSNKAKNNKLWHSFVKKSMEMAARGASISMVTPSSIFNDSVGFGKWFKREVDNNFTLVHSQIHREVKHFDVGVETSHWTIRKGKYPTNASWPEYRDPIIDSIVNKVKSWPNKIPLEFENSAITKEDFDKGSNFVYYSGKNSTTVDKPLVNNGQLKIVFPFSASYSSQFVTTEPTAHFNRVFFVKDQDEADRIMSFTLSKLFKFFAANFQKTSGFTPAVKNSQIPLLDTTRIWTNQELYDHFNLTPNEIKFVEGKIK